MSLTVNDLEQINKVVTGVVNGAVTASEGRLYGAIGESEVRMGGVITGAIAESEERMGGVITGAIAASEQRLIKQMDRRFDAAALATAELVDGVLEHMDERFAAVDERFERLEGEVRTTNRIVRQHSLDIVELRSKAR